MRCLQAVWAPAVCAPAQLRALRPDLNTVEFRAMSIPAQQAGAGQSGCIICRSRPGTFAEDCRHPGTIAPEVLCPARARVRCYRVQAGMSRAHRFAAARRSRHPPCHYRGASMSGCPGRRMHVPTGILPPYRRRIITGAVVASVDGRQIIAPTQAHRY